MRVTSFFFVLFMVIVQSTSLGQVIPLTGGRSISAPIYWSEDTKNALATVYSVTAIAESPFGTSPDQAADLAAIENTIPRFPEGCGGRLGIGYQNTAAGFRDHHGVFFAGAILKVTNGVEPSTRKELLERREDFPKYRNGRTIWVNDAQEIKDMQPNGLHIFDVPRGLLPGVYRLTWKAFLAQRTDHRLLGLGVPDRKDQIAHGYITFHVVRFQTRATTIQSLLVQLTSMAWSPLYLDDPVVETKTTKVGDPVTNPDSHPDPVLVYSMEIHDKRQPNRVVTEYEGRVSFRVLDHEPTPKDGRDASDVYVVDLKDGKAVKEITLSSKPGKYWIRAWSTLRGSDGTWCPWSPDGALDTPFEITPSRLKVKIRSEFMWGVIPKEVK